MEPTTKITSEVSIRPSASPENAARAKGCKASDADNPSRDCRSKKTKQTEAPASSPGAQVAECLPSERFKENKSLLRLPAEFRLADPFGRDREILTKISNKTKKLCMEDPVDFFDPTDTCWHDGSKAYEEDIREVKNYFNYINALDPILGTGIPSYITIKYIDDFVGHGVFAAKDIKKGEFIGFYTGFWKLGEVMQGSSYLFEAMDDSQIFIDAERCGNFTRFINHAYSKKCNLEAIIYLKKQNTLHLPYVIYFAKKKISQGEQLLINYGKQYWNQMGFAPR